MVMRFERGQNFEEWLRDLGRPPSQPELDGIVTPILEALEMMHEANFLHRDIAPDNIIIRSDGTPVLLDFGAARRAVAEASRSLTGIVKTGYSPQEQYAADSRLQGPWTDVYALGATLYKAVTGSAPEDATLRGIDERLLRTDHAAKSSYRAGFMAAIDSCLMVNPADRPQSIAQLRQLLLAAAPPSTMQAETTMLAASPLAKLPDRPSRPAWWLLAAGFIAIVGGVYGGVQYSKCREERAAARSDDKGRTEDGAAGKNYSKVGNFACFSEAEYPESWRAEAIFCAPYGCNFGKMSQDACLTLGATKRAKTVIH